MSTDNPTQLLTTSRYDIVQFRGQLHHPQSPAGITAVATTTPITTTSTTATAVVTAAAVSAHGYRSVAQPSIGTTVIAAPPPPSVSSTTSTIMSAAGSKYVFLQHNAAGVGVGTTTAGFQAYEHNGTVGGATGGGAAAAGTGNIVLLAAEPIELSSADALAVVAAAAGGERTHETDDGELRPLSWLSDSNLIKGIVTSTTTTATTAANPTNKRVGATVVAAPTNLCIVSDQQQQSPSSSASSSALYSSTTTVHKGPSGTTTVVEYKAATAAAASTKSAISASVSTTTSLATTYPTTTTRNAHSFVPIVVTSSNIGALKPQQIYVTSNGGAAIGKTADSLSLSSTSSSSSTSNSNSNSSSSIATHHPHKKYLREKMNVLWDHQHQQQQQQQHQSSSNNHHHHHQLVASTVTVVSSPASSNNSSLSSCSASGSSTAAVNGGNSPVPKASSFNAVFDAVNYAPSSSSSSSSEVTTTPSSSGNNNNNNNSKDQMNVITTTTSTTATLLNGTRPPGFTYINSQIIPPANIVTETARSTLLPPGSSYTTLTTTTTPSNSSSSNNNNICSNNAIQPHSPQLSVSPPPPPMTPTSIHNGGGSGGASGGVGNGLHNLQSPNSYTSYENEDSLKEFDLVAVTRMHTSTPQQQQQYITIKNNNNIGGTGTAIATNANGYGSASSTNGGAPSTNGGAGGGGGGSNTPQKQKHPHNVPYDPLVHTNNKPPYSFSSLIFMAIEGSVEKALPVKEIYAWIVQHFPYFKTAPNGWKNSVRHNLSLNKSFVKVEKAPNMGKGSLWRVEPQQRQNLIQALNRSPFFPNSAVDKISPSLKSPVSFISGHEVVMGLDNNVGASAGGVSSSAAIGAEPGASIALSTPGATTAVALATPTRTNGLVLAPNVGASQTAAVTPTSSTSAAGDGSGSRFDPKLFPNLSRAFSTKRDDQQQQQIMDRDRLDDEMLGEYATNNNNNNNKYNNYSSVNGIGNAPTNGDEYNFERLARDCGADSMDDVHAAAAMLFLKHGSKVFTESFQNGAPVITSSPSEDHTYSAGGNSNADSGASTPLTSGQTLALGAAGNHQNHHHHHHHGHHNHHLTVGGGADSNCASSDAAYDSSEENHNITPEELADQQRQRDGVDALLSLSRSSIVECGSVATTHYHSNGSGSGSASSLGSPHKRAARHSLEEDHHHTYQQHHHHHQQQQQQQQQQRHPTQLQFQHHAQAIGIYTNGSGSKMALLSSAAANVAQQQQQQQQLQQQQQHQQPQRAVFEEQQFYGNSPATPININGNVTSSSASNANTTNGGMYSLSCLPGSVGGNGNLSAIMGGGIGNVNVAAATVVNKVTSNKVKPLRGLRNKIKRKSSWMR
ncbi:uncharacterized protein CHES-1-like [Drosophila tropicalis]|uniref:uncharacterized protein CHES-1-like n=1 Tax=Drosophila tropicalis TaxID=46794 RepID=UPI0035AB8B47